MHNYLIRFATMRAVNSLKHTKVMDGTILFRRTSIVQMFPLYVFGSNIKILVAKTTLYIVDYLSSHNSVIINVYCR